MEFFKKLFRNILLFLGLSLFFMLGYNLGVPNTIPAANLYSKWTGKAHCGDIDLVAKDLGEEEVAEEKENTKENPRENKTRQLKTASTTLIPKIKLPIEGGYRYLDIDEIILCSNEGKDVDINYRLDNPELISIKNKSLSSLWGDLMESEGQHFFKSKDYLVNLKYVNRIMEESEEADEGEEPDPKYRIIMDNGKYFYLPAEKFNYFQEELDELTQ